MYKTADIYMQETFSYGDMIKMRYENYRRLKVKEFKELAKSYPYLVIKKSNSWMSDGVYVDANDKNLFDSVYAIGETLDDCRNFMDAIKRTERILVEEETENSATIYYFNCSSRAKYTIISNPLLEERGE